MKKLFTLLVALCATVALWSKGVEINGINYVLAGDSATVTYTGSSYYSGSSYSGAIDIPASVNWEGATYRVTSIDTATFYKCTNLTSITIPNSVTSIGLGAFINCTGLTSITIPNSVRVLKENLFASCKGLVSVSIPSSVTMIGKGVFYQCTSLRSIVIPDSVTRIEQQTFSGCTSLASVQIGKSLTEIDPYLFSGCTSLVSITIPDNITDIEDYAFNGCTGLASITIPKNVSRVGTGAFRGCTGLASVVVEDGNSTFDSRNNCNAIIRTAENRLVIGCKATIIPNTVTSIGVDAFDGCSTLTSITIPNSVTKIDETAFSYCTGLTSITVDSTNSTYDSRNNCNAIIKTATNTLIAGCKNTVIPKSVTSIDDYAFYGCTGLTSVTIPNSVTSIGKGAFWYCTGLTSITCYATTPPTCGSNCFNNVNKSIPLYVPAGSVSLYQAVDEWKEFTNIQAIGATDTTLSVNQPQVTPGSTAVTITWPKDSQADTYTITITKGGVVVCTLTFNAQGQLTNIAFAPGRGASQGNQAAQTINGYQFTVTGLEAGTNYNYTVTSSANGTTLSSQSGTFTTGTTALTDIQANGISADGKYIWGGKLYIRKAGHLYTPAGHQVK